MIVVVRSPRSLRSIVELQLEIGTIREGALPASQQIAAGQVGVGVDAVQERFGDEVGYLEGLTGFSAEEIALHRQGLVRRQPAQSLRNPPRNMLQSSAVGRPAASTNRSRSKYLA